jgi:hypothetical protein
LLFAEHAQDKQAFGMDCLDNHVTFVKMNADGRCELPMLFRETWLREQHVEGPLKTGIVEFGLIRAEIDSAVKVDLDKILLCGD